MPEIADDAASAPVQATSSHGIVEEVRAITDPIQRAEAACAALLQVDTMKTELRDIRDFAFNELVHTHGMSLREVAQRYSISKTQVSNIVS